MAPKKKTAKKKAVKKQAARKAPAKKAPAKKAGKKTAKKTKKVKEIKLTESQEKFILDKVKSLGTIEKVRNFYSLDDNVCKFAIKKAEELFGK